METINKIVDWIVSESCEDICQICANFGDFPETPDDVEPCPYKRKDSVAACGYGIIKYFEMR